MLPSEDIRNIRNNPQRLRNLIVQSTETVSVGGWTMAEFGLIKPKQKTFKVKAEVNHSLLWRNLKELEYPRRK